MRLYEVKPLNEISLSALKFKTEETEWKGSLLARREFEDVDRYDPDSQNWAVIVNGKIIYDGLRRKAAELIARERKDLATKYGGKLFVSYQPRARIR